MGDIADMMLDGTMCQYCGCMTQKDGVDGPGYPISCKICVKEELLQKKRRLKNALGDVKKK